MICGRLFLGCCCCPLCVVHSVARSGHQNQTPTNEPQISAILNLDSLRDRAWQVQACSAKMGEGLQEGMEWVVSRIGDSKKEEKK